MHKESKFVLSFIIAFSALAIQAGHKETYAQALKRLASNPSATRADYINAEVNEVCRHPELSQNCLNAINNQMKIHPYIEDNDFSQDDETVSK